MRAARPAAGGTGAPRSSGCGVAGGAGGDGGPGGRGGKGGGGGGGAGGPSAGVFAAGTAKVAVQGSAAIAGGAGGAPGLAGNAPVASGAAGVSAPSLAQASANAGRPTSTATRCPTRADACPALVSVGGDGCPARPAKLPDRDADGIPDGLDACVAEAAGTLDADENGCRDIVPVIDRDRDGFPANQDCDDTDAGFNPRAVDRPGNRDDENCDGRAAPYPRVRAVVSTAATARRTRTAFTRLLVRGVPARRQGGAPLLGGQGRQACLPVRAPPAAGQEGDGERPRPAAQGAPRARPRARRRRHAGGPHHGARAHRQGRPLSDRPGRDPEEPHALPAARRAKPRRCGG